jgi:hypothetical protein
LFVVVVGLSLLVCWLARLLARRLPVCRFARLSVAGLPARRLGCRFASLLAVGCGSARRLLVIAWLVSSLVSLLVVVSSFPSARFACSVSVVIACLSLVSLLARLLVCSLGFGRLFIVRFVVVNAVCSLLPVCSLFAVCSFAQYSLLASLAHCLSLLRHFVSLVRQFARQLSGHCRFGSVSLSMVRHCLRRFAWLSSFAHSFGLPVFVVIC